MKRWRWKSCVLSVIGLSFAILIWRWLPAGTPAPLDPDAARRSSWSVSISELDGLPILTRSTREAMSAGFAFWDDNWSWAGLPLRFTLAAPYRYTVTGHNKVLDFDLAGDVSTSLPGQLVWQIDLDARSTRPGARGGMVFQFDLDAFGEEMGEIRLLPENRGWSWGEKGGTHVEMRFEPPLPAVFLNRGKRGEVRAFFFDGQLSRGQQRYTLTLRVSGGVALQPTISERFGMEDAARWPMSRLSWYHSPVDLSFLNAMERPAGHRGFVKAGGEGLKFEDGSPARFWGTNLSAHALFVTSKTNVRQQARRLSELGFNLVRFTHLDSPWANPNIFGRRPPADTQTLHPDSLDKLDWWIKCLKDEGIHVWLDLHYERAFTEGDGIIGFNEIRKVRGDPTLAGYNYVNPSIRQAMKRFNEAFLSHVNAYTGVAYKHEPAIMGLLITNENDITHHFGNLLLPNKGVPLHNRWYMDLAAAFSSKMGLPSEQTWHSWEPGPSKLFLNDLEHRFNVEMISHLRGLGVKALIATTSLWGDDPLSSLPALTDGDIVDVHTYGGTLDLEKNPLAAPNMVNATSVGQVANKPMAVTEWNVSPFPVPDRHAIPLRMASAARFQGWDAMMLYAYGQSPLNSAGYPSNWHACNDPALIATLPAAALLYRQGHLKEAVTTYALAPTVERLFYQTLSPDNTVAARTASERGKLVLMMPETGKLPWLKSGPPPVGAEVISNLNQSVIGDDAVEVLSDTGEIRRNWVEGVYTINTPRTQAAMGWLGHGKIALEDVAFDIKTQNATVAVQSLDGRPIGQSTSLMITAAARSSPSEGNRLPFRSEPVLGRLTVRASRGLKLYASNEARAQKEIPVESSEGRYNIELGALSGASWLYLRSDGSATPLAPPVKPQ